MIVVVVADNYEVVHVLFVGIDMIVLLIIQIFDDVDVLSCHW